MASHRQRANGRAVDTVGAAADEAFGETRVEGYDLMVKSSNPGSQVYDACGVRLADEHDFDMVVSAHGQCGLEENGATPLRYDLGYDSWALQAPNKRC